MDDLPIITSLKNIDHNKHYVIITHNDYQISKYKPNSNLSFYLKNIYKSKSLHILSILSVINKVKNITDIDFNFCKKANSLNLDNLKLCNWLLNKGFNNGCIYNPKQLYNLYPNINIYQDNKNNIIVKHKGKYNHLCDFCKMIINKSIDSFLCDFKILQFPVEHKSNQILIILFWGNNKIGNEILQKIKLFNFKFNLLIVKRFGLNQIFSKEYFVIETKEFGNDIIPSLIGYNFANNFLNFNFILKLQTKSEVKWRNPLINFFLNKSKDDLIKLLDCNEFICHPKFNLKINLNLLDEKLFLNLNWKKSNFPAGSIFFCKKKKFENILKYIESNNFTRYFTQNMYDNHYILKKYSGIHFLERLVGINLDNYPFVKNNIKNKFYLKNILFLKNKEKIIKKKNVRYEIDEEKNKKLFESLRKNIIPKIEVPKKIITNKDIKNSINEYYKRKKPIIIIKDSVKTVKKIIKPLILVKKREKKNLNNLGKLSNYYTNVTHCYGWKSIMSELKKNIDNKNIFVIDNIEKYFSATMYKALKVPWIGFIHCPHNIPSFLKNRYNNLEILLKNKKFLNALSECSGLISFSEDICKKLSNSLPQTNIFYLKHPITIPNDVSLNNNNNIENVKKLSNSNSLVFLGQHLRRNYLMFKFLNLYKVIWLPGIKNKDLDIRKKVTNYECSIIKVNPNWENITINYYENKQDYFKQLKSNIVILTFFASNANNSILDIISLKIPALVEYNKQNASYLGENYPGFFNINELDKILENKVKLNEKLNSSYKYLEENQNMLKKELSLAKFINGTVNIINGLKVDYLELRNMNILKVNSKEKIRLITGLNNTGTIVEYIGDKKLDLKKYNMKNNYILSDNNKIVGRIINKGINYYVLK